MTSNHDPIRDLVEWLRTQLDEDALWALAASAPYFGDGPTVPGGMHWTWAVGPDWEHIKVDPTWSYVGEARDEDGDLTLVTVEEFPLDWDARPLAGSVLSGVEEVRTGDGGHIVRWHPARVLAEITAKRRLLDAYEEAAAEAEAGPCAPNPPDAPPPQVDPDAVEMLEARLYAIAETLEFAVRLAALPLADRPGYQEEWRPWTRL
jgi:hypothetical protein